VSKPRRFANIPILLTLVRTDCQFDQPEDQFVGKHEPALMVIAIVGINGIEISKG
jgi:hypothetical protein